MILAALSVAALWTAPALASGTDLEAVAPPTPPGLPPADPGGPGGPGAPGAPMGGTAPPPKPTTTPASWVTLGFHGGYGFRVVDPTDDDRLHGGAASLLVEGPPLLGGFSARLEGLVLAWPAGTPATPRALWGVAPSLTYRFDDTAVLAIASLGVVAGTVVDDSADPSAALVVGGLAGLLIRFPLGPGLGLDARLVVPITADGANAAAMVGLSIDPIALGLGLQRGESPLSLVFDGG